MTATQPVPHWRPLRRAPQPPGQSNRQVVATSSTCHPSSARTASIPLGASVQLRRGLQRAGFPLASKRILHALMNPTPKTGWPARLGALTASFHPHGLAQPPALSHRGWAVAVGARGNQALLDQQPGLITANL